MSRLNDLPPGVHSSDPHLTGEDPVYDGPEPPDLADGLEPGIVIDMSHSSADDLNWKVCQMAEDYGRNAPVDWETLWTDAFGDPYKEGSSQFLSEEADAAVDWMNEHLPEHLAVSFDENCLVCYDTREWEDL